MKRPDLIRRHDYGKTAAEREADIQSWINGICRRPKYALPLLRDIEGRLRAQARRAVGAQRASSLQDLADIKKIRQQARKRCA